MTTFLGVVEGLLRDPGERAAYSANPDRYLDDRGFGVFDAVDVEQALLHAIEVLPPTLVESIDPGEGLDGIAGADVDAPPEFGGTDPGDLFDTGALPDTAEEAVETTEATTDGLDDSFDEDLSSPLDEPAALADVVDDPLTSIDPVATSEPDDDADETDLGDAWLEEQGLADVDPELDAFDA